MFNFSHHHAGHGNTTGKGKSVIGQRSRREDDAFPGKSSQGAPSLVAWTQALFSSQKVLQFFLDSQSHRIL
jgi:hypothetical protein